jgi:predicted sulfurtransferase
MMPTLALCALLLWPAAAQAPPSSSQPSQSAATHTAAPKAPRMASDDVLTLLEKGQIFFLDVREPQELETLGTFEGYVNIPVGQIEKRLGEIPKDKTIVTA